MSVITEKVHFYSGPGLRLVGILYKPRDLPPEERRPGIVLCHGFGGLKEGTPPGIATALAEAGYVVLTFDYRGFGESEGVRGRLIPTEQSEDIRNAITYLEQRPEVDGRIGLYGTSFGGANVCYTAAMDPRALCVVASVPVADGDRWMRAIRPYWQYKEFVRRVEADRKQRVLTGKSQVVDRYEIMINDPETDAYYREVFKRNPEMQVQLTLESAEAVMAYKPEAVVHRISPRPLLLITVDRDVLVPPEEAYSLYEKAGEPKKLVVLPGLNHFAIYDGEPLRQVMAHSLDWYRTYLPIQTGGGGNG